MPDIGKDLLDEDSTKAFLDEGLLTIKRMKTESAKRRKIPIS